MSGYFLLLCAAIFFEGLGVFSAELWNILLEKRYFVPVLQLDSWVMKIAMEPGARRSRGRSSGIGLLVELPTPPCAAWRAAAKAEAAAASDGSRDGRGGGHWGLVPSGTL